jgi:hypothetical protein
VQVGPLGSTVVPLPSSWWRSRNLLQLRGVLSDTYQEIHTKLRGFKLIKKEQLADYISHKTNSQALY